MRSVFAPVAIIAAALPLAGASAVSFAYLRTL